MAGHPAADRLTAETAARRLEALARRWRRRRALALGFAVLTAGALAWAVARRAGAEGAVLPALVVTALAAALAAALARRHRPDAAAVARHLDRTIPDLEDSTGLLLASPEGLSSVERLQRERVLQRLGGLEALPPLPERDARRALGAGAAVLVLAAALLLWPSDRARAVADRTTGDGSPAPGAAVTGVRIALAPPAYTGRRAGEVREWELDVPERTRITWRVTVRGATAVRLLTSAGDTVGFARDGDTWVASLEAGRSLLYRLQLLGGDTVAFEDHRLVVQPDRAPVLSIVAPEPRTVIPAGGRLRVPVAVLAADDYGIAATRLVATVTSGEGESVRFREQILAFDRVERRARSDSAGREGWALMLRATLDLAALGMQPGDELYFHALATDNRRPGPNTGRSETAFIELADTAAVTEAGFGGLALSGLPEFFRSQRQIIIDTERLLADRRRLATAEFRDRSNGLGVDQGLLRLRYSEFLGDEFEAGEGVAHEEPGAPPDPARPEPEAPADAFTHAHDDPENATLLDPGVKGKLRAAVDQMWQAELRLRTYDPRGALPHEYRALELLKEVQQDARTYVQRVGFEPPPLEPDRKRLTGELDGIRSRSDARREEQADSLPAIRGALVRLPRLRAGVAAGPSDPAFGSARPALEAAGAELAELAVADPRHLETLRDLRRLIAQGPAGCAGCLDRVERGLRAALPAPDPVPAPRPTGGTRARRYFELLERNR